MDENNINDHEPEKVNNKEQESKMSIELNDKVNEHENSNKVQETLTISSSEDDPILTNGATIIIPIQMETKNIDLISRRRLKAKYKPCPKSKKKFPYVDDNDEVPSINTEADKTYNGRCLSKIKRKRKPGPKSKTMFVDDMVPSNGENKDCLKKIRSND